MTGVATDPFAALEVAAARRSVVAFGGTLDAATLVSAYRAGCFPWPDSGPDDGPAERRAADRRARALVRRGAVPLLPGADGLVPWFSPEPRAVLLADEVVVRRSLRARLRSCGWTATVDSAFDDVVSGCADRTEGTWITDRMRQAYGDLHRQRAPAGASAHSVEVWDGTTLVGGLYGVLVGQVFCGESMFHRATDASKVALVELAARLLEAGGRLIDVQQETSHLSSLGQVLVRREDYLDALRLLRDRPAVLATDRRPVARLAPRSAGGIAQSAPGRPGGSISPAAR
ncbi:MAG: aat [Frankiales bacterium]|nr:aat [Frankiales bacterium]